MVLQIEIQSTKFTKPITPTPTNLRYYKIGLLDEIATGLNIRVVLIFSFDHNNQTKFVAQLEKSLEKTLPQFYPLAGRYDNQQSPGVVDCSDQGVEFKHAKTNITLEEILDHTQGANLRLVDQLMASERGAADQVTDPILSIQVTTFECGRGATVSVSVTHRIVDASTLGTFLNHWASINRQENDDVGFINGPVFNSPSFFPPRGLPSPQIGYPRSTSDEMLRKYVTKRLAFSNSEISNLKEKIITPNVNDTQKRSKLHIVTTLICNIFIKIDQRRTLGYPRDFVFLQPINLRGKTKTLIPKDSCGNLCGLIATEWKSSNVETTEALTDVIGDSVKNAIYYYSNLRLDNEEGQTMVLNSLSYFTVNIPQTKNVIMITSWCNFPFYETNFGFGKPTWVSCGSMLAKNGAFMIDGVGGNGVEAYIGLENEEIPYFEEALKAFGV